MKIKYLYFLLAITCFAACQKPEGFGGTSTIKGIIIKQDFNNLNQPIKSYGAPDESVYIIFGENEIYDEDVKTHYDGKYEFTQLRKGKYKLFAYSECEADSCNAPSVPIIIEVEINENNKTINVPDIIVNNF